MSFKVPSTYTEVCVHFKHAWTSVELYMYWKIDYEHDLETVRPAEVPFKCPIFYTLTVLSVLQSQGSLSKLKTSVFNCSNGTVKEFREARSLIYTAELQQTGVFVSVWRNRYTLYSVERSTGSLKGSKMFAYFCLCVWVIACPQKHAGELEHLTATILQASLEPTKSQALKFTS